jgi:hypothetical protein
MTLLVYLDILISKDLCFYETVKISCATIIHKLRDRQTAVSNHVCACSRMYEVD